MPAELSSSLSFSTQAGGGALVSAPVVQSGLSLGTSVGGRVVVRSAPVFSHLFLSAAAGSEYSIQADARSRLRLGTLAGGSIEGCGDAPGILGEPIQYGVNVASGALSRYQGFGFDGFARCGQALYGARADGLYRIRPGDDDGEPIRVLVDLGRTDFGALRGKAIDAAWLGISTDGEIHVHLQVDGRDYTYRALQKGEVAKAVPGKGLKGREWRVEVEILEATELQLDMIELAVNASARRWRG